MNNIYECITSFQYGIEVGDRKKLVRCKDCKKRYTVLCIQEEAGNINNQDDWFCADGVAKDMNVLNKEGR